MTSRLIISAWFSATTAFGLACVLGTTSRAGGEAGLPAPPPATLAYALDFAGESTVDLGALLGAVGPEPAAASNQPPRRFTVAIRGELRRTDLERTPDGRVEFIELREARAVFADTAAAPGSAGADLSTGLRQGFFVRYNAAGQASGIAAATNLSRPDLQAIRALVAHLQWSDRPGPVSAWQASEPHPHGTVLAEYRVVTAPLPTRPTIQRRWLSLASHTPARPNTLGWEPTIEPEGEVTAEFDPTGRVYDSLRGHETLRTRARGRVIAESTERLELRRVDTSPLAPADQAALCRRLERLLTDAAGWQELSAPADPAREEAEARRVTLDGETAVSLLAAVARADTLTDSAAIGRLGRQLAALFALEPGACDAFAAALLEAPAGSWRHSLLVGALAAAGTESAHALLARALQSARDAAACHALLIGLAECRRPSPALVREVRGLTGHADPMVRNTAWLVLGAMAHQSDARGSERIVTLLRDRLQGSTTEEEPVLILALGNARPNDLAALLEPLAASSRPEVRAGVARALAPDASADGESTLLRLLRSDADAEVRTAAADALGALPRSGSTWTAALGLLDLEREVDVRRALLAAIERQAPAILDGSVHRRRMTR